MNNKQSNQVKIAFTNTAFFKVSDRELHVLSVNIVSHWFLFV